MKIMTDKKLNDLISKKLYEEYERRTVQQELASVQEKCMKLEWRVNTLEAEMRNEGNHGVEVPVQ